MSAGHRQAVYCAGLGAKGLQRGANNLKGVREKKNSRVSPKLPNLLIFTEAFLGFPGLSSSRDNYHFCFIKMT